MLLVKPFREKKQKPNHNFFTSYILVRPMPKPETSPSTFANKSKTSENTSRLKTRLESCSFNGTLIGSKFAAHNLFFFFCACPIVKLAFCILIKDESIGILMLESVPEKHKTL